jgi:hypothetical protein
MRKLVIFLGLALLAIPVGYVFAGDTTTPQCESGQRANDPTYADKVSSGTSGLRQATAGSTSANGAGACEGEHWDGQDPTGSGANCEPACVITPSGTNGQSAGVGVMSAYDQSAGDRHRPDPTQTAGDVVEARAAAGQHTGADQYNGETYGYAGVNIYSVGDTAVAVDPSQGVVGWYGQDNTGQGLQSETLPGQSQPLACQWDTVYNAGFSAVWGVPGTQQSTCATTGGYVLADLVHVPRVTEGQYVGPESGSGSTNTGGACTQQSYVAGTCTRDNTAITIELLS